MENKGYFDFSIFEGKSNKQLLDIAANQNSDGDSLIRLILFTNDANILSTATNTIYNESRLHSERRMIYATLLITLNETNSELISKKLLKVIKKLGQDANIDLIKYYEKISDEELIKFIIGSEKDGPIYNFALKKVASKESAVNYIISLIENNSAKKYISRFLIETILKLDSSNKYVRNAKMHIACSDNTPLDILEKLKESTDNNVREMAIINLLDTTNDIAHMHSIKNEPSSNVLEFVKKDEFSSKDSKDLKAHSSSVDWEKIKRQNAENQKRVKKDRDKSNEIVNKNKDSQQRW